MKTKISWRSGLILAVAVLFASCKKEPRCHDGNRVITTKVFATGLNNPRGLKFGPDGKLYVAEGGIGGTNSSTGCTQVVPPVGPYTGSPTGGRISWINAWGERHTLTDQLPSSQNALGEISGVGDVAFMGNSVYALITGGGCSHGVPSFPNSLVKVAHDGSWKMVANLSEWLQAHPVAQPEADDFEPDGDWYSMDVTDGNFYALEANHGDMVKITPGGEISRVVDISKTQGHIVPTSIIARNGNFFVGNLRPFPIVDGSSNVYKITPGGDISVFAPSFSTILGVAFDNRGRLYVLENTTGNPFPTPGAGKIIRINHSGERETIASGLTFPTGMTFGPDGKLYVSNIGFGPDAIGGGQILQINLRDCQGEDLKIPDTNAK